MNAKLFEALAKVKAARAHAEACRHAIRNQADRWLTEANKAAARLTTDEATALDPAFNSSAARAIGRDRQILRQVRDGY